MRWLSAPNDCPLASARVLPPVGRRSMTNTPNDQRGMKQVRIIETLSGQVQGLANAGSREAERVGTLEQIARSIQEAVQNVPQQQGTGTMAPADHLGIDALVGKRMVPGSLTNKTGFRRVGGGAATCLVEGVKGGIGRKAALERTPQRSFPRPLAWLIRGGLRSTCTPPCS